MKKNAAKTILFILLFLSTSVLFAQTNWTMANANSNRTSYVADETQLEPPFIKEFELSIKPRTMAIKDNVLILAISGSPNIIKAYDLNTKATIWEFAIPNTAGSPGMVPSISGNTVFVSGQHGAGLYALDITNGNQKWLKPLKKLYAQNSITDSNNHVFITSGDSLFCLNVDDGKTIWTFEAQGLVSPTIKNDTVFITTGTSLNALKSSDGEVLWSKNITEAPSRHMPVDNNTIYHLGHNSNKIRAFSVTDGTGKWEYTTPGNFEVAYYVEGSGCLIDSILCVTLLTTSDSSKIIALNKFTGELLWDYTPAEQAYLAPPIAANGFIYTVSFYKELIVLNEKNGEVVMEDTNIQGRQIIYNHQLIAAAAASIVIYKSAAQSTQSIDFGERDIVVYPNPTSNEINVAYNLASAKHIKIELYNLAGKKVDLLLDQDEDLGIHDHQFITKQYKNGTYILIVNDGEKMKRKKIVVAK